MVREWLPTMRYRMSPEEASLGIYLRGNTPLMQALCALLQARISGRAKAQEPSDPMECKSMIARDREIQWLLGRLDFIYHSPVNPPGDDAEPPTP